MKAMKERGVTYYVIDKGYTGSNKELFREFLDMETLFVNDVTIMYDWSSGLCIIEDSKTSGGPDVSRLPAIVLTKILMDDDVYEWMHRSTEEDRIDAS